MAKASFKFSRSRTAASTIVDELVFDPCGEEIWSMYPDGVQLSLLIDVEDLYLSAVVSAGAEDAGDDTGTCATGVAVETATQSSNSVAKSTTIA